MQSFASGPLRVDFQRLCKTFQCAVRPAEIEKTMPFPDWDFGFGSIVVGPTSKETLKRRAFDLNCRQPAELRFVKISAIIEAKVQWPDALTQRPTTGSSLQVKSVHATIRHRL